MNRNLVEIALQELGAEDRALLELSVVRGVSDEDIAELLDVDIARVLIKREEALGRVSALIEESPEEVLRTMRALPGARWRDGEGPRTGAGAGARSPSRTPEPAAGAGARARSRSPRPSPGPRPTAAGSGSRCSAAWP